MNPLASKIDRKVFHDVGAAADSLGREAYVVGGYVRDLLLDRDSQDIDFVTVGSGIELAKEVAQASGRKSKVTVFKNYGTARLMLDGHELEFVGARRESYSRDSRNPIVENGTLQDDISRRDFTINAMAICVNNDRFGELVDLFDGLGDIERHIIRTPLDPDITFSDDPLRMMRAIRFATQLNFTIHPETLQAISRNAQRIGIITRERIAVELEKIMLSPKPSIGWNLLYSTGLLALIFPELNAMKGVETVNGRSHKDNFDHTMIVLDRVASSSKNLWLRWAALLHDIAKPVTKRWDDNIGWTFHNHNFIGAKMVDRIFRRMKMPLNEHKKYVAKLVELHMRPIALVEEEVTDSAVRRLIFEAGDDIEDLMTLCEADITSRNREKVKRYLENFAMVRRKMDDLNERDAIRNFQPPVDGIEIMATFNLKGTPVIGQIKQAIKDAILDGRIRNNHDEAHAFMLDFAASLGLKPVIKNGPTTDL